VFFPMARKLAPFGAWRALGRSKNGEERERERERERATGKLEKSGTESFSPIYFSSQNFSFLRNLTFFPRYTFNRGESVVIAWLMQIEAEIFLLL
jgi:hypothetical protein